MWKVGQKMSALCSPKIAFYMSKRQLEPCVFSLPGSRTSVLLLFPVSLHLSSYMLTHLTLGPLNIHPSVPLPVETGGVLRAHTGVVAVVTVQCCAAWEHGPAPAPVLATLLTLIMLTPQRPDPAVPCVVLESCKGRTTALGRSSPGIFTGAKRQSLAGYSCGLNTVVFTIV